MHASRLRVLQAYFLKNPTNFVHLFLTTQQAHSSPLTLSYLSTAWNDLPSRNFSPNRTRRPGPEICPMKTYSFCFFFASGEAAQRQRNFCVFRSHFTHF